MLWIGLHLPWLSLESFAATLPSGSAHQPVALLERHRVVAVNRAARDLGVRCDMKRATALSLAPRLIFGEADPARDARGLQSVVHAALAFSPAVSVAPPAGVVIEVRSVLRYFGGIDALLRRLLSALAPLGHRVSLARAPTAQAALLLSRWDHGLHCIDAPSLHELVAQVPVALLDSAAGHLDTLTGMGLGHIGDLRRLPRDGVARRFGEAVLDEVDRAWGLRPDPREPVVLAPVFDSEVELFARADTTEQLLHGAEVLLARLVAWLSAQHAFVRRFRLVLRHEGRLRQTEGPPRTDVDIALAEPSRDAHHLQSLLRERLAAFEMPAPTLEMALHAEDIARQPPPNTELFPTPRNEQEGLTRLIERLQARLGVERVQRLVRIPDHRPEHTVACVPYEPGTPPRAPGPVVNTRRPARRTSPARPVNPEAPPPPPPPVRACPFEADRAAPPARPVWLLPAAQALGERQSRPMLDGQVLRLLSGPERIESGWWDASLAERDYFIAQTPEGALVWLYRARLPWSGGEGWFLQGRFG